MSVSIIGDKPLAALIDEAWKETQSSRVIRDDHGFSVTDLAFYQGIGERTAQRRIREMVLAGKIRVSGKRTVGRSLVDVYLPSQS